MRRLLRSVFAALTIAPLLYGTAPAAPSVQTAAPRPAVAVTLEAIYRHAYADAYRHHALMEPDGTTFVSTGDIHDEWLRDASATMTPYIAAAQADPYVRAMVRGTIAREARYVLLDPYANAFTADYHVAERKFEMDSLLYPVWFTYLYWKASGDTAVFTPELQRAFQLTLRTLRTEQRHATLSHYRDDQLANGGRGTPIAYTGLVWTGFRPSDDAALYHYNIPDNMFGVVVLRDLTEMETHVYHDRAAAADAWGLSAQIAAAIERYGVVYAPGFGRIYAYEVDGLGHANLMDDANIPSLLSIPYFGYLSAKDPVYAATRRFVLSPHNPYYFSGKYAAGIGSPHTPQGYVWPLALVMEILTSTDPVEVHRVMGYLAASDTGDHLLHESFDPNEPTIYTRADFAWPNALFAQMVLARENRLPQVLEAMTAQTATINRP